MHAELAEQDEEQIDSSMHELAEAADAMHLDEAGQHEPEEAEAEACEDAQEETEEAGAEEEVDFADHEHDVQADEDEEVVGHHMVDGSEEYHEDQGSMHEGDAFWGGDNQEPDALASLVSEGAFTFKGDGDGAAATPSAATPSAKPVPKAVAMAAAAVAAKKGGLASKGVGEGSGKPTSGGLKPAPVKPAPVKPAPVKPAAVKPVAAMPSSKPATSTRTVTTKPPVRAAETPKPVLTKVQLNCDPTRNPDARCCSVVQSVMHRKALGCGSMRMPNVVQPTVATGGAASRPMLTAPRKPSAAAVPATLSVGGQRAWSVDAMTQAVMRNREARQSARDSQQTAAAPAAKTAPKALPTAPWAAKVQPKAAPKATVKRPATTVVEVSQPVGTGLEVRRSKPRDGGMLYVTWAVEPCDADPDYVGGGGGCQEDNKPGQFYSRHPHVVLLMMLKRWALSVRRADPTARIMVLTDERTALPDFSYGCNMNPAMARLRYDVHCTDFVEWMRVPVQPAQLSLARLQALSILLRAETERGWNGHVVSMDTDSLLLRNLEKAVRSYGLSTPVCSADCGERRGKR